MRYLLLIALSVGLLYEVVAAGEIAGRVFLENGGEPLPVEGAEVIVSCEGAPRATATSDARGFYSVLGSAIGGTCEVSVRYEERTSDPIEVTIAGDTTVALVIRQEGDRLELREG